MLQVCTDVNCNWAQTQLQHKHTRNGEGGQYFCFILTDQRDTSALVHHGHGLNLAWRETCLSAGGLWEAAFSPLKQPIKVQTSEAGPEAPQSVQSGGQMWQLFCSGLFWPILHSCGEDPGHQVAASAGRPRPILPPATSTSSSRVRELSSRRQISLLQWVLVLPRGLQFGIQTSWGPTL